MTTYGNHDFEPCKLWIETQHFQLDEKWDDLYYALKEDDEGLELFLQRQIRTKNWPSVSVEEWHDSIRRMQEAERTQIGGIIWPDDTNILPVDMLNKYQVPNNPTSSWQIYSKYLREEKHWPETAIDSLQNSAKFLLNRLGKKTEPNKPIQGLVLGYVQSGKTANMEALMAMAADHGWNFFIILGGTKENLRIQTRDRMLADLAPTGYKGVLNWRGIEHPSTDGDVFDRPQTLFQNFDETSKDRFFTVCLKQPQRLQSLINWIQEDISAHKKMRIVIIDDEADQASINSKASQGEIATINGLIRKLVQDNYHRRANGDYIHASAVNYIMYTATPYANFLNEADSDSLYPHNFIYSLEPSQDYLGPNQYFGGGEQDENDGLDIKRIISKTEITSIKQLQSSGQGQLPEELQKSIAWFYCCAAIMRIRFTNSPQPVSMLIHTSQRQQHHEKLAEAVKSWISTSRQDGTLLRLCRDVYEEEKARETIERWRNQLPTYGSLDKIEDYPSFEAFENNLYELLNGDLRYLQVDERKKPIFDGTAPYLAIDNSANNRIENDEKHRLLYPDPHDKDRIPAIPPAYIVIGGNTLARGLTLEGLVSTYFLRTANQYDSLMQMGRWFGYRRRYELLPRLWLSADTLERFEFLAEQEQLLRNELKEYAIRGVTPDKYAPAITLSGHSLSWLRPTRSGAMTNAVEAEHDFSGASPQTITFDNDSQIQQNNLNVTDIFINALPAPHISYSKCSLVFENVSKDSITHYLHQFKFCRRGIVFSDIDTFIEYLDACAISNVNIRDNWHVIVVGVDNLLDEHVENPKRWNVRGYSLKKVNRSKLRLDDKEDSLFYLKAISSQADKIADLDLVNGPNRETIIKYLDEHNQLKKKDVDEVRRLAELTDVPLLIIYRIDKDSQPLRERNNVRAPLNSANDLIGLQICIPGCRTNFVKKLRVRLPNEDTEADGLEEED